jgi:glycosyltransferase involved in cell wall biosynthesis
VIYADQRWIGNHGIGRFARHVLEGLEYSPLPLGSNPAAPLDSLFLSRALRDLGRDDLFFSPGYNTPLFCRAPFVFTIHDLNHVYCPESTKPHIQLYYATVMKRACRAAARILTVSEFSRQQIIDWAGVSPDKVCNVGCGVDAEYRTEGDVYGLPFPYVLSVSNRKPHKNDLRVVKAFASANLDSRMHLVFTGEPRAELVRTLEAHGLSSRADFVGLVPEERLPSLYRGAEALIFPSLYEGFGLPILEAMACGVPVVTSNVTGMPEVAGDAAMLVDPRSVEEISHAMGKIVSERSVRQQLIEKGISRAAGFSWTSTVNRVQKALALQARLSSIRL